ncbi:MAG: FKBP-type peptidyl-prolyl cis-trans isomerase [Labilithrix sp.]|nr:FKBP-type peptidyl-prolyl cis-trans isomerase [Labilithrix sp.]MCW5813916.1 FKBP-type peptidyl-prolyl cis-trans isomerase [Labilithrix sp.]
MHLAAILLVSLALVGCSKKVEELPQTDFKPVSPPPPQGPKELVKEDVVVGWGPEAKEGDTVKVHYTGTLLNGTQFDSSVGKAPFSFQLGKGNVIKGWDQGVPGMKVGGKRKLTIPSELAYGENGSGDKIPPNSPLKFDVELLEIEGVDAGPPPKDAGADAATATATAKKDAG